MRCMMIAVTAMAVSLGGLSAPALAAKSKMGCEKGSEIWNATEGKCVPGTPKANRPMAKKPMAKKPAQ